MSQNKKNSHINFNGVINNVNPTNSKTAWRKKNSRIILFSSILGLCSIATLITVPLVLVNLNTSPPVVIPEPFDVYIRNVFDFNSKSVRLLVTGKQLPKNLSSYKIFNMTAGLNNAEIASNYITLSDNTKPTSSEIDLTFKFTDPKLTTNSTYQIVIYDGSPSKYTFNSNANIPQPIITINTQPVNQTILESVTTVNLLVDASVSNPLGNIVTPSYQWYISDSNDSSSFWETIPNATQREYVFNLNNIQVSTRKYFKCILTYEYAAPVSSTPFFVEKITSSQAQKEKIAIDTFNAKPVAEKITFYNDVVVSDANLLRINDHLLKSGGMVRYFEANVIPNSVDGTLGAYNRFKLFLSTYNAFTPSIESPQLFDRSTFLKMKGQYSATVGSPSKFDNNNNTSTYLLQMLNRISVDWISYQFFSPVVESITNIEVSSNFSLTMTLTIPANRTNLAYWIVDGRGGIYDLNYKSSLLFDDSTLFPGMSLFVKSKLLTTRNY